MAAEKRVQPPDQAGEIQDLLSAKIFRERRMKGRVLPRIVQKRKSILNFSTTLRQKKTDLPARQRAGNIAAFGAAIKDRQHNAIHAKPPEVKRSAASWNSLEMTLPNRSPVQAEPSSSPEVSKTFMTADQILATLPRPSSDQGPSIAERKRQRLQQSASSTSGGSFLERKKERVQNKAGASSGNSSNQMPIPPGAQTRQRLFSRVEEISGGKQTGPQIGQEAVKPENIVTNAPVGKSPEQQGPPDVQRTPALSPGQTESTVQRLTDEPPATAEVNPIKPVVSSPAPSKPGKPVESRRNNLSNGQVQRESRQHSPSVPQSEVKPAKNEEQEPAVRNMSRDQKPRRETSHPDSAAPIRDTSPGQPPVDLTLRDAKSGPKVDIPISSKPEKVSETSTASKAVKPSVKPVISPPVKLSTAPLENPTEFPMTTPEASSHVSPPVIPPGLPEISANIARKVEVRRETGENTTGSNHAGPKPPDQVFTPAKQETHIPGPPDSSDPVAETRPIVQESNELPLRRVHHREVETPIDPPEISQFKAVQAKMPDEPQQIPANKDSTSSKSSGMPLVSQGKRAISPQIQRENETAPVPAARDKTGGSPPAEQEGYRQDGHPEFELTVLPLIRQQIRQKNEKTERDGFSKKQQSTISSKVKSDLPVNQFNKQRNVSSQTVETPVVRREPQPDPTQKMESPSEIGTGFSEQQRMEPASGQTAAKQEPGTHLPLVKRTIIPENTIRRAVDASVEPEMAQTAPPPMVNPAPPDEIYHQALQPGVIEMESDDVDLVEVARRVLPIIKRMLKIERERFSGR
jgi:hypothetical protein